jgi:hypothetical protein
MLSNIIQQDSAGEHYSNIAPTESVENEENFT